MLIVLVLSSFVICCAVAVTLGYRIPIMREWLREYPSICGIDPEYLNCGNGLTCLARTLREYPRIPQQEQGVKGGGNRCGKGMYP